jgi:hypothetical protein
MGRIAVATAISGFLALLTVQSVSALQLLTNGDFETASFVVGRCKTRQEGVAPGPSVSRAHRHPSRGLPRSQLAVIHTAAFTR